MRDRLSELDLPSHLFQPPIDSVDAAFQPTSLSTSWSQLRGHLTAEVMMAWRWCAWYMNGTEVGEDEVNVEALQNLAEQLRGLEEIHAAGGLPKGLRNALERQIESLQRALQTYALVGASALDDAYTTASGIFLTADVVDEDVSGPNAEVVSKMKATAIKTAAAIGKTASFLKDGLETLAFFKGAAQDLLGTGG